MRQTLLVALLASALPVVASQASPAASSGSQTTPSYVTAAMDDPARGTDRNDDARRQMAAVMVFAGVKPGQKVMELVPGSGYWTRVFSGIVGGQGHVYTIWPQEMMSHLDKNFAKWGKLATTPHYANVSVSEQPVAQLEVPAKVDLAFTVQNYHDLHDVTDPAGVAKFDKQVYDALKPGGLFVIVDHVAPAGSGLADTGTLHRIDPAAVKQEVEAAGFVFDGESDALRNPADPHTAKVFDPSIRGHTDQFIYRFRKPE
ncbi:class I SAM-dependent methyltransferase [Rhodanobacter sp. DHB23]|uniref:class I SAM-dependent methyltransferase n=1 Tax=Rhodanobacter sp. DHB23 TaxID=2775923 RepID=UPI00177CEBE9|nr:class I SAM-dependent methyltransferase [Rhodanobacter sp. DHB23]MBD8872521.1 class I SAM-dependent methyltransferase [Rhodanobacter sp. DHB23]